ncbi:MAG TPA: response regulator [Gemmatimonadales bacterium]|nr:response regulator [Gemmatimonadales bacterium]
MEFDSTPPHGPDWRGASVLIVDDESPIRKMLRRKLEAQAFQVEEADNGEAALRLIQSRSEPFHLVLTDLTLPEIDGWQVAVTLRRYRPSVAVICMSGHPKAVPPIDHAETPVPVLAKPFTTENLYLAIRREITRAADLTALTESEIAEAHTESSRLEAELQESRTARAHMVDLITAARELRADAAASTSSSNESG